MASPKKTGRLYAAEVKEEALKLTAKVGIAKTAREHSIYECSTLRMAKCGTKESVQV